MSIRKFRVCYTSEKNLFWSAWLCNPQLFQGASDNLPFLSSQYSYFIFSVAHSHSLNRLYLPPSLGIHRTSNHPPQIPLGRHHHAVPHEDVRRRPRIPLETHPPHPRHPSCPRRHWHHRLGHNQQPDLPKHKCFLQRPCKLPVQPGLVSPSMGIHQPRPICLLERRQHSRTACAQQGDDPRRKRGLRSDNLARLPCHRTLCNPWRYRGYFTLPLGL